MVSSGIFLHTKPVVTHSVFLPTLRGDIRNSTGSLWARFGGRTLFYHKRDMRREGVARPLGVPTPVLGPRSQMGKRRRRVPWVVWGNEDKDDVRSRSPSSQCVSRGEETRDNVYPHPLFLPLNTWSGDGTPFTASRTFPPLNPREVTI